MSVLKYSFGLVFIVFAMASQVQGNDDLSSGLSLFARDFFWECGQSKTGNIIVSPLSVSTVLTLLSQGANENTLEQLRKGLHLNGEKSVIASEFLEHNELLRKNIGNVTLSLVNKIYVKQGYQLNKNVQDVAANSFKSGVESVDFEESEQAAKTINQFVEQETHGNIKELVMADMFNRDTRTVLVNAIYFKGSWAQKFPIEKTKVDDFRITPTEKVPVEFMNTMGDFKFARIDDLDAFVLEMEYADSDFSFVIALPKGKATLREVEEKIKEFDFNQIMSQLETTKLLVKIPKFKIEYDINLNDILKNLGMRDMFEHTSDLSGLVDGTEPLMVSDVVQKAFIEVNEEGAEASAATAVTVSKFRSSPPAFRADRPFLYFIRATDKNTIIFSGRVETF